MKLSRFILEKNSEWYINKRLGELKFFQEKDKEELLKDLKNSVWI